MRSCMYCGRDLSENEKCNCPGAVKRREEKKKNESTDYNPGYGKYNNSDYYRTGYTKKESKIKRMWSRFTTKRAEKKNRRKISYNGGMKGFFNNVWSFIKSPVDEISNPKNFSIVQMLLISAVQGAIIGMGIFFVITGASRSWFRFLANVIGFGGIEGYKTIGYIALSALSGAVGAAVMFLIYSGVFYLIGKFVFRSFSGYLGVAQRLVMTTIPFTAFAAIGVVFSFFSTTTLLIMLLTGVLSSMILTYVSLNEEWSQKSSYVFYAMLLGYFVLFTIICSLIRVSII